MVGHGHKHTKFKRFYGVGNSCALSLPKELCGSWKKDIKEKLTNLERTVEDYEIMTEEEKRNKTTSLEEFLDGLKEDYRENENT